MFESVSWVAVSEDALMFQGDGSFGTLIKGTRVGPGPVGGTWSNCRKPTEDEAKAWLRTQLW